jgi:nucleoside-diphosphate-sugar epimerase
MLMSRIIVTGGAGFIGSHVVQRLVQQGHQVRIIDAFMNFRSEWTDIDQSNADYRATRLLSGAEVVRGNMLDAGMLRDHVTSFAPEYIIHLAALSRADIAIKQTDDAYTSILGTTKNLLECVKDAGGVQKLLYVSSSMVYGDFQECPVPEYAPTEPKEIYGGMKLAGENLVKAYSRCFGMNFTIVRPSAVYGPSDTHGRVISRFLSAAVRGQCLVAKNADETVLDFTFVEDVANGITAATFSPLAIGETFNITCGEGRSLREVIELLRLRYPKLQARFVAEKSFRPKRGALDISKARSLLGYAPSRRLEEGLLEYARQYETALNTSSKRQANVAA